MIIAFKQAAEYDHNMLMLLAGAAMLNMAVDAEFTYWQENNWTQQEMWKSLYPRVKKEWEKHLFVKNNNVSSS